MGPFEVQIFSTVFGVLGGVAALGLILRFKLKKKELEMGVVAGDAELGPVVDALRDDLNDTRAQLADMQEHTRAELAEMQERLDFAERLLTAGRAQEDRSG